MTLPKELSQLLSILEDGQKHHSTMLMLKCGGIARATLNRRLKQLGEAGFKIHKEISVSAYGGKMAEYRLQ